MKRHCSMQVCIIHALDRIFYTTSVYNNITNRNKLKFFILYHNYNNGVLKIKLKPTRSPSHKGEKEAG